MFLLLRLYLGRFNIHLKNAASMPIYLVSEALKVQFKEGIALGSMKEDVGWFVNVGNNLLRRWGG